MQPPPHVGCGWLFVCLSCSPFIQGSESDMDKVRGLLKRWREKVYALLVQKKLQEIEEARSREEMRRKVS